ncbi:hypothetical protein DPMN_160268 [Dreissena polymorpha]|uniref:Uncharacterized protein n=1 Tax=Dreissena polymorpha TaxID=45954 RepID=A0A9D4EN54_DREPO|nr:hypothetical protein DPMN_160268 [Dreissena polymorpha]
MDPPQGAVSGLTVDKLVQVLERLEGAVGVCPAMEATWALIPVFNNRVSHPTMKAS